MHTFLGLQHSSAAVSCMNSHAEASTCVDTAGMTVPSTRVHIPRKVFPHSLCQGVGK